MKKDNVIRVGDSVRIIDPRPIIRCDYDETTASLTMKLLHDEEILAFCRAQGLTERCKTRVIRACAVSRILRRNGQHERQLVLSDPREGLKDKVVHVSDRVVRKTGKYVAPSAYQDYFGEWECDPGGLANEKTHVCFAVGFNVVMSGLSVVDLDDSDVTGLWPYREPQYGQLWFTREQLEKL